MTVTTPVHPWSEGFEWADHAGPFTVVTEEQASAYDRDGYFVLPGVIEGAALDAVTAAIDPIETATVDRVRAEGGKVSIIDVDVITFTAKLAHRDPVLGAFAIGPLFAGLCADLVGPVATLWWDQAVYKKPEAPKEFPWHQDNGYGHVRPEAYLTCWIPLVDATVDNGCPWVMPGVHRQGTLVHEWTEAGFQCLRDPRGAVPVPARRGDIVVFSSLTPHRTGPNLTGAVRKAYILQYCQAGARRCEGDPQAGEPVEIPVVEEWMLPVPATT